MGNQQRRITTNFRRVGTGHLVSECGTVLGKRGNPLNPSDNGRGYLIIRVGTTSKAVHRLVAEAWVPNPYCLPEVNHIDGDKKNNSASNLEWCSRGYNIKHCYHLNNRSAKGVSNANCKSDIKDVVSICEYLRDGLSATKIRDLGFNYNLVRKIKARKTWTEVSEQYSW